MTKPFEKQINRTTVEYHSALERLAGMKAEASMEAKASMKNKKEEFFITPVQVEIIHDEMIRLYGGLNGIRDNNLFLSVCEAPYQEVFGQKLYPEIIDKAAKLLEGFIHYQAFLDGNKRTGFETMVVYLGMNDIKFDMTNDEAYEFVMDIVNGKYQKTSEISGVITAHSYKTDNVEEKFRQENLRGFTSHTPDMEETEENEAELDEI